MPKLSACLALGTRCSGISGNQRRSCCPLLNSINCLISLCIYVPSSPEDWNLYHISSVGFLCLTASTLVSCLTIRGPSHATGAKYNKAAKDIPTALEIGLWIAVLRKCIVLTSPINITTRISQDFYSSSIVPGGLLVMS